MNRIFSFAVFVALFTVDFAVSANSDSHEINLDHKKERIIPKDEWETYSTGIYGPYGWNGNSLVIELALVIDNEIFKAHGNDPNAVIQDCQNKVYAINSDFQKLNIYIALVYMDIWTSRDMINMSTNGQIVYDNFIPYAEKLIDMEHGIDAVFLISKRLNQNFITRKSICDFAPVIIPFFGEEKIYFSLLTILGMYPKTDCEQFSSCETNGHCHVWPCAVKQIMENFATWKNEYRCLKNKPTRLFGAPVCGNGYLEGGEECDCGSTEKCNDLCCEAKTCRRFPDVPCLMGKL